MNAPTGGTKTPTTIGENTHANPRPAVTNTFSNMITRTGPSNDPPRNPKNDIVDRKCSGDPTTDSVSVSAHVRPAYLGPNKMHIGQKKKIPKSTPEQMLKHMIKPKFDKIRIVQNAAVGTEASNDVPAALIMVGPRCEIAASTRFDRLFDRPVKMVSLRCKQ